MAAANTYPFITAAFVGIVLMAAGILADEMLSSRVRVSLAALGCLLLLFAIVAV